MPNYKKLDRLQVLSVVGPAQFGRRAWSKIVSAFINHSRPGEHRLASIPSDQKKIQLKCECAYLRYLEMILKAEIDMKVGDQCQLAQKQTKNTVWQHGNRQVGLNNKHYRHSLLIFLCTLCLLRLLEPIRRVVFEKMSFEPTEP